MKYWIIALLGFIGIFTFFEARSAIVPKDRSKITIFSHASHVDVLEFDCETCHENASESGVSGDNLLPKMEVCMNCHDGETAPEECEFCHQDTDNPVAFENPEREIIFNHQYHLETESLECDHCHKDSCNQRNTRDKRQKSVFLFSGKAH